MIRYFCKQCNMETKFSECPVCVERTELEGTSVYWCKSCKIPTYDEICPICGQKGKHLTTDVRPVYPAGELVNWLPVCKSKSLFLKVLARLNSGIQIILWFNGIYDSKLELTKPNRLNQLLEHDKIISDQAPRWEKAHFKRRSNSSFFFCKIKFHPVVMGTSDACPRQNV